MKPVSTCLGMLAAFSLGAGALLPLTTSAQAEDPQTSPATPPETTQQNMPPETAHPGADIPEEKIEQFATAFADIQTIQMEATKELEATTDEAEADRVVSNAETQMIAAVERSGLEIQEFNRIAELMTTDVAVRARVAEKLQQRSGG